MGSRYIKNLEEMGLNRLWLQQQLEQAGIGAYGEVLYAEAAKRWESLHK